MDTYAVHVTRDDGLWSAVVSGLPATVSAGYDFEHFTDVQDGVREALVDLLERRDFDLNWTYAGAGRDFTGPLREALHRANSLEAARSDLEKARREAITEMHRAGLSYRDIADALGISHQRVSQLNRGGDGRRADDGPSTATG